MIINKMLSHPGKTADNTTLQTSRLTLEEGGFSYMPLSSGIIRDLFVANRNTAFDKGLNPLCLSCITDTIHPLNFDWTRSDVEPLWLYEHVKAAKWNVNEVADFVKYVTPEFTLFCLLLCEGMLA